MIKEYKDWLFVKVPEGASGFDIYRNKDINSYVGYHEYDPIRIKDCSGMLPPGSWQIIGKGDALSMFGWAEIVDALKLPLSVHYKDYMNKRNFLNTATESGHSLLRSLKMEPGTTLVLKKQTK